MTDVDVEEPTCGCAGPCEHAPALAEVVIPPLRPRVVQIRMLDRQGLVAMAYGRGAGPILAMASRRAASGR